MTARYIVMTSTAQAPRGHRSLYRNVAVVETDGTQPKLIRDNAKGLVRIVRRWQPQYVGKTTESAYYRALREAQLLCDLMNSLEGEHAAPA